MGNQNLLQHETEKIVAPPDFSGPTGKRRCTDGLFSILLITSWAAMTYFGYEAIKHGDHRVVLYPMDYDGNICGTDYGRVDMTEYKFFYPVNFYSGGVCVKSCPKLSYPYADLSTLITYSGVYQLSPSLMNTTEKNITQISGERIQVADYSESHTFPNTSCSVEKCMPFYNPLLGWNSEGINEGAGYAFYAVDTNSYLNRCIVSGDALGFLQEFINLGNDETEFGKSNPNKENKKWINKSFSDIYMARQYILGFGLIFAVVIGFVYAFLLQIPGILVVMVWGSLLASIAVVAGVGYYAYEEAQTWKSDESNLHTETEIRALQIAGYFLWGLSSVLFCLMCAVRKRIFLAIGVVKEAAKAISAMPLLIFFPLLQCIGLFAFVSVWIIYVIFLASLGSIQTDQIGVNGVSVNIRAFEYDKETEYQGWYLLFCFFWTSQFIIALGEIIIALSTAKWFFTKEKSSIGNKTVVQSMFQGFFFHAGTAAFGSLIIAVISMIRSFLAYIQRKAKNSGNRLMIAVLACLQCFMCCLEKCMKFINKNAYIQTAIFGTSFCQSAREAFFLILRNIARVGTLSAVSEVVVILGKIFVAAVSGGCGYIFLDGSFRDEIHSPIAPVIFIILLSYFAGSMFMNVFSMVTSTILQCFIADEEMFNGSEESFSDESLKSWIDSNGRNTKVGRTVQPTS